MDSFIKLFPTSIGKLFFSPCPDTLNHLQEISQHKICCIFNLAAELSQISSIEKQFCPDVINGNIEDYDIPKDIELFYKQIQHVIELLKQDKSVLIHCNKGHGRTSMALACIVLILEKYTLHEAINKTKKIANGPGIISQIKFIEQFCFHMKKSATPSILYIEGNNEKISI